MSDGINRRRFLKVLGVTGGGAAALSACGIGPEPTRKLVPYLVAPEDQIPGNATFYASTCRECAAGCGIHVRVREGHAVKIEGNPESPVNAGRLCARGQAALQGLYNPDRLRTPLVRGASGQLDPITWDEALARLGEQVQAARGRGIVFLTGHDTGAMDELVDEWLASVGGRRVRYEPFAYEALREGNRLAFGTAEVPQYDVGAARYVLSFGADFLDTWLDPVAYQNAFARARSVEVGRVSPARLVYVGPRLPVTGMNADEWLASAPGTEGKLALALAYVIVRDGLAAVTGDDRLRNLLAEYAPQTVAAETGVAAEAIERVARDFVRSGAPLALAGGMAAHYPNGAGIVAAVNVLNHVAGAAGKTVRHGAGLPVEASGRYQGMADLQTELAEGAVALLLVRGTNPAHSMSGAFAQSLDKAGFVVSFATTLDETTAAADLVLPDLHPLEEWNDLRPRPGVVALQQPVMMPVFADCRGAGDVLLGLLGRTGGFRAHLEGRWRERHRAARGAGTFEEYWMGALRRGGVFGPAPTRTARLTVDPAALRGALDAGVEGPVEQPVCVVFPHPVLHDGRGADKPWLQELPDPVTKIAWHSWVEVHPETAREWSVVSGDLVLLTSPAGAVRAPVWITPSVRAGTVAVPTGQGHVASGRYARDRSFNAFSLLGDAPTPYGGRAFVTRVSVAHTGEHRRLASVEGNSRPHGRGSVETIGVAAAAALSGADHPFHHEETPEYARAAMEHWAEAQRRKTELGNYAGDHPRWGLAVDLTRCTGCSACVTACYAENNIATVGEELLTRGREMSWLRIERYWLTDDHGTPQGAVSSPMMCQQCGNAPCEPVCPVYAAYHTPDGLNGQVYNRCVGTRYCANNCPYKVRYFNWYNFAETGGAWDAWPEPLHLLLNPDVTVREKGVMEKCTFCVQRIRGAQNAARLEDRKVRDGEIVPACAQTCPSEAIVFGDLADPQSRVSALARDPRGYHVLAGLNTRPAVTYLARVVHADAAAPAAAEH
jgi:molybdopterin-containing oxidoreductase family iron-sulfur binding subunit